MQFKNILKPILFIGILLFILFMISYFALPSNSMEDGPYKKNKGILAVPQNTLDYIAMGDSECSTSITPMEIWKKYGYAGYNCGVPGQRLQDAYYLLNKLLQKQSPKVILFETNEFFRDFSYTASLQNSVDEATKKLLPIYKYHNSWKYFNLDMFKNVGQKVEIAYYNPMKGYHYNPERKPYIDGPYVDKTSKVAKIQDQPLLYLNKIIQLCKDKDIQLIFYTVPSPLCWTYEKHNAAAAIAKENNLLYLDLNLKTEKVGIDWSKDTRDYGNHVNFYGAKKVSRYIGKYLSKNTELKDRREEVDYQTWNMELPKYLKVTKQKLG